MYQLRENELYETADGEQVCVLGVVPRTELLVFLLTTAGHVSSFIGHRWQIETYFAMPGPAYQHRGQSAEVAQALALAYWRVIRRDGFNRFTALGYDYATAAAVLSMIYRKARYVMQPRPVHPGKSATAGESPGRGPPAPR